MVLPEYTELDGRKSSHNANGLRFTVEAVDPPYGRYLPGAGMSTGREVHASLEFFEAYSIVEKEAL